MTCGAGANSCAAGVATLAPTCQAGKCGDPKTQACALGCFQDGCLGVTQVAAGYSFACAVLTDKKVRCWGSNSNGQLGQGTDTTTQFSTPKEVQGLTDVVSLAATFSSTCALMSDHTVKCWGSNQGGELGLGNTDPPSRRSGNSLPTAVATEPALTCAAELGSADSPTRIAFPLLAAGHGGLTTSVSLKAMVDGMRRFFRDDPGATIGCIVFAVPEPEKYALAKARLDQLLVLR